MQEELITFDTAKLAKEKGFNITTKSSFLLRSQRLYKDMDCNNKVEGDNEFVSAPTQSLLQRWLREVHNIHVWGIPNNEPSICDGYVPIIQGKAKYGKYNTYEQALEAGLQEALKLI